jgi:hypothetical protein
MFVNLIRVGVFVGIITFGVRAVLADMGECRGGI